MTKTKRQYGVEFLRMAKAAEFAAASKLVLLGHDPMFPSVDDGVDIVLENGLRLQVKCSNLRIPKGTNYRCPAYGFGLRRGAWDSLSRKYVRNNMRTYSEVADYFVLWGIDENRFFIVPTSHKGKVIWFTQRGFISTSNNAGAFAAKAEKRLQDYEDRWDLLDVSTVSSELVESATEKNLIGETKCL